MFALLLFLGCQRVHQKGEASWYGRDYAGKKTASGDRFRPWKKTAAHKTLPIGTKVKVKRIENGKVVRVVINDRGPYVEGRIIDLSRRAARKLNMVDVGVADVEIYVLGCKKGYASCK